MTVGLLHDRGFGVNYNSEHVVLTGNNLWWIPENSSLQSQNRNKTYLNKKSLKHCKCLH